jgi:hypothetical protein
MNTTSQSPTDSPPNTPARALQRKKLLYSRFEIEAGWEEWGIMGYHNDFCVMICNGKELNPIQT